MNRRDFLNQAATMAASTGLGLRLARSAEKEKEAMVPIVDTHQHLWDLGKFRLPWTKNHPSLNKNFVMADYLKATAGLNVVKSVYMEVDVDPAQQQAEAEYVIDICRKGDTPMKAAVISGRPAAEGFKKYITQFKDSKDIKGVRQVLHNDDVPAGFCLDQRFVQGIRLLGELGMSFDLCMRSGELLDGAKLIDSCPDTRFILDHCGNANVQAKGRTQWRNDMAAVARRKNVVGKVSGIVASAKPGQWTADDLAPIVKHTIDVFGKERVMFGGDWPVCTLAASYKQWVEALKAIVADWTEEDRKKLFHDNAARFYGLS